MPATRVLVIDDSLTMRALISGALERIPDVEVVGAADGAAEARTMIPELKPDVLTLDVEMPGMSGIEYLAEVMAKKPMPVIMFSTRTEAGAASSVEALRLGAIDCFPKPKVAAQNEFDAIIGKLGKRIKAARTAVPKAAPAAVARVSAPIDWNGRPLAIAAEAEHTGQLFALFEAFPQACPPVIVVQHLGPGLVEGLVAKLDEKVAPKVVVAKDGDPIQPGTIYFAPQGDKHLVVDRWPEGRLRLYDRDPVGGERPSASLLFASLAKAAGAQAIGMLLSPQAEDGPAGLRNLAAAGADTLTPDPAGIALARGDHVQRFPADKLAAALLKLSGK